MKAGKGSDYASKLRWRRKTVRQYERRMAEARSEEQRAIVRARYERAVALLMTAKLTNKLPTSNGSVAKPLNQFPVPVSTGQVTRIT